MGTTLRGDPPTMHLYVTRPTHARFLPFCSSEYLRPFGDLKVIVLKKWTKIHKSGQYTAMFECNVRSHGHTKMYARMEMYVYMGHYNGWVASYTSTLKGSLFQSRLDCTQNAIGRQDVHKNLNMGQFRGLMLLLNFS